MMDKVIKCPECGSMEYSFLEYRTLKDGTKVKVFKCKICKRKFREKYRHYWKIKFVRI